MIFIARWELRVKVVVWAGRSWDSYNSCVFIDIHLMNHTRKWPSDEVQINKKEEHRALQDE